MCTVIYGTQIFRIKRRVKIVFSVSTTAINSVMMAETVMNHKCRFVVACLQSIRKTLLPRIHNGTVQLHMGTVGSPAHTKGLYIATHGGMATVCSLAYTKGLNGWTQPNAYRVQPRTHKGPVWLHMATQRPFAALHTQRTCLAALGDRLLPRTQKEPVQLHLGSVCCHAHTKRIVQLHLGTVYCTAHKKGLCSCTWGPFAARHTKRNCIAALRDRLLARTQKGIVQLHLGTVCCHAHKKTLCSCTWIYIPKINSLKEITTSTTIYADDVQLLSSGSPNNLEQLKIYDETSLKTMKEWYSENGLKVNSNKTQCILFATPNFNKRTETFQITIDDTVRHMEDKGQILGVIFDSRLSFEHHIKSLCPG